MLAQPLLVAISLLLRRGIDVMMASPTTYDLECDARDAGFYFVSMVYQFGMRDDCGPYLRQLAQEYLTAREVAITARLQAEGLSA